MDPDHLQENPHTPGRLGRLFAALVKSDEPLGHTPKDTSLTKNSELSKTFGNYADFETFIRELSKTSDPLQFLIDFLEQLAAIDTSHTKYATNTGNTTASLSDFAYYLADRIKDTNIKQYARELGSMQVIRPQYSKLFYLRANTAQLDRDAFVCMLKTEAALNLALLISERVADSAELPQLSYSDILKIEKRVLTGIQTECVRANKLLQISAMTEWDVRYAISFGIEAFRLPYRLTARFRCNVEEGLAAIEVNLCPPALWTSNSYVDGFGVASNTKDIKRREATEYNLRLILLIASYIFEACPVLNVIKLAGIVDDQSSHSCYVSVELTREDCEDLPLGGWQDLLGFFTRRNAVLCDRSRQLSCISPTFSLEDPDLCPKKRYRKPELTTEIPDPVSAEALGISCVRDLAIEEAAPRIEYADAIFRDIGTSTQKNVKTLLSIAHSCNDTDVQSAATNCIERLISGDLTDDPYAVRDTFIDGSDFEISMKKARELLQNGKIDAAYDIAQSALADSNFENAYKDTSEAVWRSFESYDDRVIYNLLYADDGRKVNLVKDSYPEALAIVSAVELTREHIEASVKYAREVTRISPLSAQGSLHLTRCLCALDADDLAQAEIIRLLNFAHTSEALGMGYLYLAQLFWKKEEDLAAQACYQQASKYLPPQILLTSLGFLAIANQTGTVTLHTMSAQEIKHTLTDKGIPLAPLQQVLTGIKKALIAAINQNLFLVGRDLLESLQQLEKDDVLYGVYVSMEREPDF